MASITSVITNPTVVAALFTAVALLIQNWLSGRRENKRERERQAHAERMATLAHEAEKRSQFDDAKRAQATRRSAAISEACTAALELMHERDSVIRSVTVGALTGTTDRDGWTSVTSELDVSARIAVSRLLILDQALGDLCDRVVRSQYDALASFENQITADEFNAAYKHYSTLTRDFARLARETIRREDAVPPAPHSKLGV
ncbi:hypothetical protein [Timonella senegalensis]|uniref:hypothetical protein n=1 Tax=Timonella senegalensis TaxID=1465825 RepID=UPI002FDE5FE2